MNLTIALLNRMDRFLPHWPRPAQSRLRLLPGEGGESATRGTGSVLRAANDDDVADVAMTKPAGLATSHIVCATLNPALALLLRVQRFNLLAAHIDREGSNIIAMRYRADTLDDAPSQSLAQTNCISRKTA